MIEIDILNKYDALVDKMDSITTVGTIVKSEGLLLESVGPIAKVGDMCEIVLSSGNIAIAEVIGFKDNYLKLMSINELEGIAIGCKVTCRNQPISIRVSETMQGHMFDCIGRILLPHRGYSYGNDVESVFIDKEALSVGDRKNITEILPIGVKAIDGLLTVGKGQRLGIFSGAGVGKSTLLGMIAKNTKADVNVVAMVGERTREVLEFRDNILGVSGMENTILVVSTSNESPLAKVRSVYTATAIAEFFRDKGNDVLLMVDSITRTALAQREIGASLGEPPTTKGFTPSVFNVLSKLCERAGNSKLGSITAFYNVLVEGDDLDEPISDAMRGILDGHITLSRKKAQRSHFPAIEVHQSISRLTQQVCAEDHYQSAIKIREWLGAYAEVEELIQIGAYARGSDANVDKAITKIDKINAFLKQNINDAEELQDTINTITDIAEVQLKGSNETSDEALESLMFG